MHKIAFLTDIHANLPALNAVLEKIDELDINEIIIGGDCIGIGPYPKESLKLVMNIPNASFINGNHELVACYGINGVIEKFGPNQGGYLEHAKWCNSQLTIKMINFLQKQPLMINKEIEGVSCSFMHFAIDSHKLDTIYPYKQDRIENGKIDSLFSELPGSLIGFGHLHTPYLHTTELKTFHNPGSLGCFDRPIAHFAVYEFHQGKFKIKNYAINYDDTELYTKFEERKVPDRKFIYTAFFGGRFTEK
jgi:predicted phosphodiesterase